MALAYYHMRIKYISGGVTSYFYEINKTKELVEGVVLQIEKLVPKIRFEGHMIFPKRINEYKIFVTESPSEMIPDSVRDHHPDGYDFGGDDVTLEITTRVPRPKYYCRECGAPVEPTDEQCPNGHDLSDVGKSIKLTLTEGLKLSDSVSLSGGFVVNKVKKIVSALETGPKTPEVESDIDYVTDVEEARNEYLRKIETLTLRMRYASGIFGLVLFLVGMYGLIWVFPTNVSLNTSAAYVSCLTTGAILLVLSIRPESITGSINLGRSR